MKRYLLLIFGIIFFILPFFFPDVAIKLDSDQIFHVPSYSHWGGTDSLGRDMVLRCLVGGYLSLMICIVSLVLTYTLGIAVGSLLSFWKRSNHLVVFFIDIFDSVPTFLLVALFSILLNRGLGAAVTFMQAFIVLVISIALSAWPPIARNIRLEILQLLGRDYLSASVAMGAGHIHIIWTHYRRALWPWVRVSLAHMIPQFLLIESVLSFTGLSINSHYATLGYLIYEGWKNALIYPHLFIVPSLLLCSLVFFLTWLVRSFQAI